MWDLFCLCIWELPIQERLPTVEAYIGLLLITDDCRVPSSQEECLRVMANMVHSQRQSTMTDQGMVTTAPHTLEIQDKVQVAMPGHCQSMQGWPYLVLLACCRLSGELHILNYK